MRETKVYMGMEEVNIKGLRYCMIPTNYMTFGKQKAIDTEKDQDTKWKKIFAMHISDNGKNI